VRGRLCKDEFVRKLINKCGYEGNSPIWLDRAFIALPWIGGGAVLDMAGFAAAISIVEFGLIRIPTTRGSFSK